MPAILEKGLTYVYHTRSKYLHTFAHTIYSQGVGFGSIILRYMMKSEWPISNVHENAREFKAVVFRQEGPNKIKTDRLDVTLHQIASGEMGLSKTS